MRPLARQIVVDAAVSAGLSAESVVDKPLKASKVMSLKPRVEFETIDESLEPKGSLFAVLPGDDPATHIKKRRKTYTRRLKVRAAIFADDETGLETFLTAFISALPRQTADEGDNLVTVTANRAERGGFETRMVEVIKERSAAVWINFEGGIYRDEEVPLIPSVDLVGGITVS